MAKTIENLQAGKSSYKYVVLIEGIGNYVLSDAPQAAVTTALAATDWTDFTRIECFVDLTNEQKVELWNPFTTNGGCVIKVHDPSDGFATYLNRRLYGAETTLTATVDRNDTTLAVAGTTNFTASGEAHIGTECVAYASKTGTTLASVTRGKYSPFGCDSTGSGGTRFGNHHRINVDTTHPQLQPLVTQLPRTWIGRRVGVWMHTWSDTDQALNTKADAQLVFAGRLASIGDDPDHFLTILDLEHIGNTDIKDATIGRDLFRAEVAPGMYMRTGRAFAASDVKNGTRRTANALTVVSGAPGSVNEIQQGYYTAAELADRLNAWCGNELAASRLWGTYNWNTPVQIGDGLRTTLRAYVYDAGGTYNCAFYFEMPGEAAALLGLVDTDPSLTQGRVRWPKSGFPAGVIGVTNRAIDRSGEAAPFDTCVFRPVGPGSHAQEFEDVVTYALQNETGRFINQYDKLPYAVKGRCDADQQWGIFLLDEKIWMVAQYNDDDPTNPYITNAWLAPFTTATGANDRTASPYVGRRLDEPESGPVTIRQVLVLESTFVELLKTIAYSTGTSGYNHGTYDTLGYGLGWNLPGGLLGPEFDRSLENCPEANAPMVVVIDEPTKFGDLFFDDLIIRWMFLRWRDQGFEFGEWKTPVTSMAARSYAGTTLALTEANKADASPEANHRIPSVESNDHIRPVVKIDFCRDFGAERDSKYQRSTQIEDSRAVDDAGGAAKPFTLKMKHTFAVLAQTGTPVDKLSSTFIQRINLASKAGHRIVRTIDLRYYEGYAPGDVALVTDSFARDPINGTRGISARPMMITRITYSPGGPVPSGGRPRDMYGEVELMALDVQRGTDYAPAAEIDEDYASGGFSAGYLHASATIRLKAHAYSHDLTGLGLRRGGTTSDTEGYDYLGFPAGSKVHIIERDPADPAAPVEWERTVDSASTPHQLVLTAALSAPAFDSALKYRVVPQRYDQVVVAQQDVAYQADTDQMVTDDVPAWHYSAGGKGLSFTQVSGSEKAELIPTGAYGDGRPYDAGYDHALAYSLNGFINYKSAHQSPFLIGPGPIAGTLGSTDWELMFITPKFLGIENLSSTVTRTLTVAPMFASATGATCEVRVSIGRTMPEPAPGVSDDDAATWYQNATFSGAFSQTAVWSTSSTTAQTGADKTLELNCKDLQYGFVYLIVEVKGDMYCWGLAKCVEGAREVG
jgi:hypothetical protein